MECFLAPMWHVNEETPYNRPSNEAIYEGSCKKLSEVPVLLQQYIYIYIYLMHLMILSSK